MVTLFFISIAGLAAQLVDGGLGMGFGVTSTTMLITLAGVTPAAASAIVHVAELGTTAVSGASHWKLGNVEWKVVARLAIPGGIGAFTGATLLSNVDASAAKPWMSAILIGIGLCLMVRFLRPRRPSGRSHSTPFLAGLGLFGGFIDASRGGGWGPVTTSTLLGLGKLEPRKVIGTVNTAECIVALAATLGFVAGLWDELLDHLPAVLALLVGGCIAAPIAAWLVSRINPAALGSFVGSLIVALNIPRLIGGQYAAVAVVAVLVIGVVLAVTSYKRSRLRIVAETSPAREPSLVSDSLV